MELDNKKLLDQIRQNKNLLNQCKKHKFDLGPPPYKLGQTHKCLNCGGYANLTSIFDYCKGYKAAGGNPNDIIENFE